MSVYRTEGGELSRFRDGGRKVVVVVVVDNSTTWGHISHRRGLAAQPGLYVQNPPFFPMGL